MAGWHDFRSFLEGAGGTALSEDMLSYTHHVGDGRTQQVFYRREVLPSRDGSGDPGLEIMWVQSAFAMAESVDVRAVAAEVGQMVIGALGCDPGADGHILTLVMTFPLAPIDPERFMDLMGPAQLLAGAADHLEQRHGGLLGEIDSF